MPYLNYFNKFSHSLKFKVILLMLIWLLLYILPLFFFPVSDPGESYYIASGSEMLKNNEFIVPILNNQIYFSKPILSYWLVELAYKIFGVNEWAGRTGFAMFVLLDAMGIFYYVSLVYDRKKAFLTSLAFLTTPMIILNSKLSPIDILFSSTLNIALYAFGLTLVNFKNKLFWPIIYIMLGLSVLTKGIAGLVLFAVPMIIALIILKPKLLTLKKWLHRLNILPGLILFSAITLPWYILISLKTKGLFLKVFLLYENYARFLGRTNMSKTKIWYYIPVLGYSLMPWILSLCVIKYAFKEKTSRFRYVNNIILASFVLFNLFFFSLSKTKLDTYIMPCYGPLLILLITTLESIIDKASFESSKLLKSAKFTLLSFVLLELVLAILCLSIGLFKQPVSLKYNGLFLIPSFLIISLFWYSIKQYKIKQYYNTLLASLASFIVFFSFSTLPFLNFLTTNKQNSLVKIVSQIRISNYPVLFFQGFKPSVQFYSQKCINSFFHAENLQQSREFKNSYLVILPIDKLNNLNLPLGYTILDIEKPYMLVEVDNAQFTPIPTLEKSFSDNDSFNQIIMGKTKAGPFTVPYAIGNYF